MKSTFVYSRLFSGFIIWIVALIIFCLPGLSQSLGSSYDPLSNTIATPHPINPATNTTNPGALAAQQQNPFWGGTDCRVVAFDTLPGRVEHVGRTAADNRQFVNGVLWVLRSGARWSDLPERYGKYKSVHTRFMRWARTGVWERLFADLVADRKNQYLMLDSTIVRAHQQAATGRKKGAPKTRL